LTRCVKPHPASDSSAETVSAFQIQRRGLLDLCKLGLAQDVKIRPNGSTANRIGQAFKADHFFGLTVLK
jgi:hypothetical protein